MDRDQIHAAIAQERRNIADLIDSLDDSQLATESLCTGWDVKTVGSHLVSGLADGTTRAILLSWRRMNQGKAVDEMARRRVHWPAAKIAASLRDLADRQYWRPPPQPPGMLAEILCHSGDIRIPLGLPFEPDPQLTVIALDFLTGPVLRVTEDDDDGVIRVDDDPIMRTAPLGVLSGAVVGVVTVLPSG